MNATTPYRFHEYYTPTQGVFAPGDTQWPTVLAEFIRPALSQQRGVAYWFTYYGAHFQLCLAGSNFAAVEHILQQRQGLFNIATKTAPTAGATVGTALGGSRWYASERNPTAADEARRSVLFVKVLHRACAVYLDQLIQDPGLQGRWRVEHNTDINNPLGRSFESLFHLLSNLSRTRMQVNLHANISPNQREIFAAVPCYL
ncbi:MAG TPA: hypothetical protein VG734_17920 [Lacunisphaera sp.]|nr:hypothetical protein [Lacunisphaera sp.]